MKLIKVYKHEDSPVYSWEYFGREYSKAYNVVVKLRCVTSRYLHRDIADGTFISQERTK